MLVLLLRRARAAFSRSSKFFDIGFPSLIADAVCQFVPKRAPDCLAQTVIRCYVAPSCCGDRRLFMTKPDGKLRSGTLVCASLNRRPAVEAARRPFRFQLVRRAGGIERRMTRPSGCPSWEISSPRPATAEPVVTRWVARFRVLRSIRVWVQKYEAGDFDEALEWAPGAHSILGVICVRFCPCRRAPRHRWPKSSAFTPPVQPIASRRWSRPSRPAKRASRRQKIRHPRRATVSRLAPKRIYKPRRGLNEISVLSKSHYVRSVGRDKAVIRRMAD